MTARDDELKWSHWNHRIMRRQFKGFPSRVAIYEVFYDAKKEPVTWTADPVYPSGETMEELRAVLQSMMDALDRPVLNWEEAE